MAKNSVTVTLALVDLVMAAGDPAFKGHVVTLFKDGTQVGDPVHTTDESIELDDLDAGVYTGEAYSEDVNGKALTAVFDMGPVTVQASGGSITVQVVGTASMAITPDAPPADGTGDGTAPVTDPNAPAVAQLKTGQ